MNVLENYKDLKILVTGGSGQIGSCLKKINKEYKFDFYFPNSDELNLKKIDTIINFLDNNKVNLIINLAAYTDVDKAETEKEESNLINHIGPMLIAKESSKRQIPLIHFSTDYVFGGDGTGPFSSSNKKTPINQYGRSKSLGEDSVLMENKGSLIIRVASVFGHFGNNFVKKMTKLLLMKDKIEVVSDNKISMFYANDFSNNILQIIDLIHKNKSTIDFSGNIIHMVSPGYTNWYEVSKIIRHEIINYDGSLKVARILPINSNEWKSNAERPIDSRLELNDNFIMKYGIKLSPWESSVREVVNSCLPYFIDEIKNDK